METVSCGILFPRMQTNLIPFSPFSFLTDLAAAFTTIRLQPSDHLAVN
jgi:hypothetical protein